MNLLLNILVSLYILTHNIPYYFINYNMLEDQDALHMQHIHIIMILP